MIAMGPNDRLAVLEQHGTLLLLAGALKPSLCHQRLDVADGVLNSVDYCTVSKVKLLSSRSLLMGPLTIEN